MFYDLATLWVIALTLAAAAAAMIASVERSLRGLTIPLQSYF